MKASDKTAAELAALADLPDSEIDTSDIPERTEWPGAVHDRFRRGAQPRAAGRKRMTDKQKEQIRRMLLRGMDRYAIAQQLGVTPGQVTAIRAWVTMRSGYPLAGKR